MSKKLLILVSILALSLMFVGCGADDEDVTAPEVAPVETVEPAEPTPSAEEASCGDIVSTIVADLDAAVVAEKITLEQKEAFMAGIHSGDADMEALMGIATAAELDMAPMMAAMSAAPAEEPSEGMTAEQVEMIKKVTAVIDEKIAAGEMTADDKTNCVMAIHNGELTLMDAMEQLGMNAE